MMLTTPAKYEKTLVNQEILLSSKIPYSYLLNDETIETKSGHLLQTIQLEGLYAETLDDEVIDQEKHAIGILLNSLVDSSTSLYLHMVRKQIDVNMQARYDNSFAQRLHDKWQQVIREKTFFLNQYYITVVKKPPTGKISQLSDLIKSLSTVFDRAARDEYREQVLNELNKITQRIKLKLKKYGARKLGKINTQQPGLPYSELLSFFSYLINLEERKIMPPEGDLASYLPYKRLFFDKVSGTVAFRNNHGKNRYAAILAIKHYAGFSSAIHFDPLLDLPFEIIVTQSFSFLDKTQARRLIKEQARNQAQSDDGITSDMDKIDEALDGLGSNDTGMGEHTFSVLCHAETREGLENNLAKLDNVLNEIGIIAIREDAGLKAAYFSALPANHAYLVRKAYISTKNMAGFATFHNFFTGKWQGNHWGDPITILETISGAPFAFNYHVLDVANTFLLGPMGSGKTLVEAFTLILSMKAGGRLFVFDKDRGLETAVRALGGSYSELSAGSRTGMSPFQLSDTPTNRYALATLMRMIAATNNFPLNDDEILLIKSMVSGAYRIPKKERVLRNVVSFLGMCKKGSLRSRFENWINDGDYAWVFDNEIDGLSLNQLVFGFDMTSILEETITRSSIYYYLFHQLEDLLDGTRTRIILAEGWKALQDNEFRKKVHDWSSTNRKKEVFLVIDTQAPSDIAASPIGCKIIQESVTQMYFANPAATYQDYVDKFGLSFKEYEIVKNLDKESRYFLIKQGKNSVVARAD